MAILFSSHLVVADNLDQLFLPYDDLLKMHVKHGEKQGVKAVLVDYVAWSKDVNHEKAVSGMKQFNPVGLKDKDKMVFWINAYNLLTIDLIVRHGEKESIKNLGNFIMSPWRKFEWVISGQKYSLHEIEHEILRPMGDPRIHMAINCASLSCPDLREEAYSVETLNDQLDSQVREFLNNTSKGLAVNVGTMKISKIFSWFEDDFENSGGVRAFINKYRNKTVEDIEYLDYNWKLNSY